MKYLLFLVLVGLIHGAPQYSSEPQVLSEDQKDIVGDVFSGIQDGYENKETEKLVDDGGNQGPTVVVQVVTNDDNYEGPDDYQPPVQGQLVEKVPTHTDNIFSNCSEYTATQGYQCVKYYNCFEGEIITDGAGLIDIRNGFGVLSPEDSKCEHFLDVCCKDPDFVPPPPPPIVKYNPRCGRRNEHGLAVRIHGFKEHQSQFGEWPHMCVVLTEEVVKQPEGYAGEEVIENHYKCGGSLIHPGVVMTAAHCVSEFRHSPDTLKVRCGEWDAQNETEPRPHQDRYVSKVDIHYDFNSRNLHSDWALIYTTDEFELQQHIDTICLPDPKAVHDHQSCFATGWGKDNFGAVGRYQVILKEIELPIVPFNQCAADFKKTRLGSKFNLDDSFICAGGDGKRDTCSGDGGGPLVCARQDDPFTYEQVGITAWGIGCGNKNVPGAYASVAKAACWIDYTMTCQLGREFNNFTSTLHYSHDQCQTWMNQELINLHDRVTAMQNLNSSITGRKRRNILDAGIRAQSALQIYSQCSVHWPHVAQAQPLSIENNGYGGGDGGDDGLDLSGLAKDGTGSNLPLTNDDTTYSEPKTGSQTDGTYSEPKTGSQTDGTYSEPKTGSQTDGTYSEPKTAPHTDGTYSDDSSSVKVVADTYTGDNVDLSSDIKQSEDPY